MVNEKYIYNLSKMIQKETVSHLGQTDLTKFREFHALLGELFPSLWAAAVVEDIEGNLLIKWPGKDASHPRLFMSHHDVVEENGTWVHAPFGAEIEDGKLYGRGTLDTKGNLWAMLQAADDLASEGYIPPVDIYFESACNEEITNEGAGLVSEILKARGLHFDLVLDEGPGPEEGTAAIGIGEKGCVELRFIARSSGGHASRPSMNGSLVRLGRFMASAYDHLDEIFPKEVNKETNTIQQTTLAFTMAEGSKGRNVLPKEAWIISSMRCSHHQRTEGSIAAITEFAKQFDVEVEVLDPGETSSIASVDGKAYRLLESLIKKHFPGYEIVPKILAGATDARKMSKVSDGPLRFTPFRMTKEQHLTVHATDENISLSELEGGVAFYKDIFSIEM